MTYWASGIVYDEKNDKKPWLWFCSSGELTIESAMKQIELAKQNYNLINAWIDVYDEKDDKITVYNECFIDSFGNKHTDASSDKMKSVNPVNKNIRQATDKIDNIARYLSSLDYTTHFMRDLVKTQAEEIMDNIKIIRHENNEKHIL